MKGWRTIVFNLATFAVSVAEVLPPKTAMYVLFGGNLVLRFLTTTPVGNKE